MTDTTAVRPMLRQPLSRRQLQDFAANGFLHVSSMVPERELAAPDRDSLALIERGADGPVDDERWRYGSDPAFGKAHCLYRVNDLAAADMPSSFQVLLAYPPLLAAVRQLVNGDEFAASVHALVFKLPRHGVPARWHQDPVKVFRFPVFNMDIYLDEATVDNGCLRVFPGSHLTGYHAPDRCPGFLPSWTNGSDENAAKDAIPVPAKRGDVILHATTLIHGSPWNRSADLRRTVYFHFDHRPDVELAGDRWPQRQFAEARAVTAGAIATRARMHPEEQPFPYECE